MDETVLFHTLDGPMEVGGAGRARGIWPEALQAVANKKGPDTCRFVLRREPGMPWLDLLPFTPVDVKKNGQVVWEGFVDDTPEEDDYSVAVQCLGWQHHADHDTFEKTWVHARLPDWRDVRSFLDADLTLFQAAPQIESGDGAIVMGFPNGGAVQQNVTNVGIVLDLGPHNAAKVAVIEWENIGFVAGGYTMALVGGDSIARLRTVGWEALAVGDPAALASPWGGTFVSQWRYVAFYIVRTGVTAVETADRKVRVTAARVFSDAAYISGIDSDLKASTIISDALDRAQLIDGERSGITVTAFDFPEFAMSDDRTPMEVMDAANAPHNYVLKVQQPGRRPVFRPQPTVPILRAGPWAGWEFKDSSKNSSREIFNKGVVRGNGPAGEQVRVVRYAGQQPGALIEKLDTPAFLNPSFDVDVANWSAVNGSALVRDTGTFSSSPASLRATTVIGGAPPGAETTLSGTFKKGVSYLITGMASPTSVVPQVELGLYVAGVRVAQELIVPSVGGFQPVAIAWTPSQDTTNVVFRALSLDTRTAAILWLDTLEIYQVKETMADRRAFLRSKAHSMSQSINSDIGAAIADTFLQTHMRAPLKGDGVAVGKGAVRRYLGDAGVDPAELLLYTSELIHLADQIDPNLGTVGRDGQIAQVTYLGDDERAQVSIDSTRENFEAVVERYQVVAGAGR